MMGLRKFQEMVFTGRPFTAAEMFGCNFLNKVVPRDQLEAEMDKYAQACARNRPIDTIFRRRSSSRCQAVPGRIHGQPAVRILRVDGVAQRTTRATATSDMDMHEAIDSGLADAVNDNDAQVSAGLPVEQVEPQEGRLGRWGRWTGTSSSTCRPGSPARTARNCSPTAAPTSSKSIRRKVIRYESGRLPVRRCADSEDGALFSFPGIRQSTASSPTVRTPTTSRCVDALLSDADAVVWSRGSEVTEREQFRLTRSIVPTPI